ncbi:MAG TPA: LytTR family DNA-binding domain-containing protein [Cyclobacteriaceae bacterium]|jgi:DNA-binding LytR/AlgR family response regulator
MNVLIIEDEEQAAQRLENVIKQLEPTATILNKIDSVKQSVNWLNNNAAPDLVFMDIQLADGLSFRIFEQSEIKSPVIFTTAYDEYALRAFKVNSIDYLLKPIDKDELQAALRKFKDLAKQSNIPHVIDNINEVVKMLTKRYKTRFVVKVGEHLRTIEANDIQYFYSKDKTTFCVTQSNRHIILDFSLEQLEEMIDPNRYYRINRKYLISSDSIEDIVSYMNSRLKLVLKVRHDDDLIVARERVQHFKDWLDR